MNSYIHCQWLQSSADEPIEIFSELDPQRNEVRKVEKFRGGRLGYASKVAATEGTSLGIIPVPPLVEINASPEFTAKDITAAQFEQQWTAATQKK
jgi:hypothetical protein